MWSVGCILAELYLRRPVFDAENEIGQVYRVYVSMIVLMYV